VALRAFASDFEGFFPGRQGPPGPTSDRPAAAALAADRAATLGPIVRELRQEGKTLQAVADELNARGYVTRRGKPWTHVAVLRLLNRDDLPDPKGAAAKV
jgi:hypothetical protein